MQLAAAMAVAMMCGVQDGANGQNEQRVRVRELGVSPGVMSPGPLNAITDVAGVRVGHVTIVEGDDVRTGVTAIVPGDDVFQRKVSAAVYVGNGFGKAAGFLQVQELGEIETPIVLTNTLSVGAAVAATVQWTLEQPGNEEVRSVNAVVGETNDGALNDIRGMHVTHEHVFEAINGAADGAVAEGSVGAGTGTRCFGWKGGIGTSSRVLRGGAAGGYTVGALVQSNFGGNLVIDGVRVGEKLDRDRRGGRAAMDDDDVNEAGSCMIVIATDAPLDARNLERLARRAVLGLARTGSVMSNGSGDFVIAFSTANRIPYSSRDAVMTTETLRNDQMTGLFQACVESVEEAVYNSLTMATTVTGRDGNTAEAIPLDRLRTMVGE